MAFDTNMLSAALALGLASLVLWAVGRTYLKFRGKRVITCPATGQPAAVELAAWRIACTFTIRGPKLRLRNCSRWRQEMVCDHACLPRIGEAPDESLVVTILSRWYHGKICTCCGTPMEEIAPWRHKPCFMSPDLRLLEWREIQPEAIPHVLQSHLPVCRRCLVAETHTF